MNIGAGKRTLVQMPQLVRVAHDVDRHDLVVLDLEGSGLQLAVAFERDVLLFVLFPQRPRSLSRRLGHGLRRGRFDPEAKADRQAIPAIDHVDQERELHLLLICEMGRQCFPRFF